MRIESRVDSASVKILEDGSIGGRRIIAVAPGSATVHAEAFGASADLELEVLP